MANFVPLLFLDAHELAASLRQHTGLFDHGTPRILTIREPRNNTTEDDEDFIWRAALVKKWRELHHFLGRTRREAEKAFGPQDIGHIYLEMLDAGVRLPWADGLSGSYAERYTRLHLALRTNPQAMMYSGAEVASPAPGWLTAVNFRVPHSAINLGDWPRVHLVVDFRKKDAVIEAEDS